MALASPLFNATLGLQMLDPFDNATLIKETVVHIQLQPAIHEELDLAGVYMHQVSSGLQDWTSRIYQFMRNAFVGFSGTPSRKMHPGMDRRKLYVI
jgi:hypothetical protein